MFQQTPMCQLTPISPTELIHKDANKIHYVHVHVHVHVICTHITREGIA